MKATISLHFVVTFYTGLTLINCDDWYYKDGVTSHWQPSASLSYGKTRLAPDNHIKNTIGIDRGNQNISDDIPAIVYQYEALPLDEFPSWMSEVLNPAIFSQSNPFVYLFSKTVKLTADKVERYRSDVKLCLQSNKFPSYYVPYAKMLSSILNCHSHLQNLRRAILNIGYLSDIPPLAFTLPAKFATPVLSAMFSPDVFLERNPPSVVLNKIAELPENSVLDLISQLDSIYRYGGLPRWYNFYVNALRVFMRNSSELKSLRKNISEIKSDS